MKNLDVILEADNGEDLLKGLENIYSGCDPHGFENAYHGWHGSTKDVRKKYPFSKSAGGERCMKMINS